MPRLEVFHEDAPSRCVLVSVSDESTYEELCKAVHVRLGILPEHLCIGQTNARVLSVHDLREGDQLRVIAPKLATTNDEQSKLDRVSRWRPVIRLLLATLLFLAMEAAFQRCVYQPFFRPAEERMPVGVQV
jgi:hypothetical protein